MTLPPPDPKYILRCSNGSVTAICTMLEDSNLKVATGSELGEITIWNMITKRKSSSFIAHSSKSILALSFFEDTSEFKTLASLGKDGFFLIWNNENEIILSYETEFLAFCPFKMVQSLNLIAVPYRNESEIKILQIDSLNPVYSLKPLQKLGLCMDLEMFIDEKSNKTMMLIAYESGSISFWNIFDEKEISSNKIHDDVIMCFTYSSKINFGASGSVNNNIVVWKLNNDQLLICKVIETNGNGFSSMKMKHDEKIFVVGGWDGNARVFGRKSAKQLAVLSYHSEGIQSIEICFDGTICLGSKDGTLSIWDVYK